MTILTRAVFLPRNRERKAAPLAQLSRIEGVGKGILQLAAGVGPPPVRVPPVSRAVARD